MKLVRAEPERTEFKADAVRVAPTLVVWRDGWEETLANGKAASIDAFVGLLPLLL